MHNRLKGIMPAIASPCDENDVFQEDTFASLAEHLAKTGIHGFYVCGATGDGFRMGIDERKKLVEIVIDIAGKRNQAVIVHVGTNNTRQAVELAAHAAQVGADAVSSVPPANTTQKQLLSYYSDIAKASSLPLLVYHIPMLTGRNPGIDEMLELLDIEGVVGLKMTDWNLFFMKRLKLARPDTVIFNGFDESLCPGLLYGAAGGIGTNYNLFPELFVGIYDAVVEGNIAKAMELQNHLIAYADLLWRIGVVPLFEYLMKIRGFGPYCFRKPRNVIDTDVLKKIKPELNALIDAIEKAV
ncbi:MAG: dihydrodipicolinate synthase family protein [Planctomycetota bacterium]